MDFKWLIHQARHNFRLSPGTAEYDGHSTFTFIPFEWKAMVNLSSGIESLAHTQPQPPSVACFFLILFYTSIYFWMVRVVLGVCMRDCNPVSCPTTFIRLLYNVAERRLGPVPGGGSRQGIAA